MKRNTMFAAAKAVMVGVIISGMATACQNGDSPVGSFLQQGAATSTVAQNKNSATTQSDEERKAEQARKIAEFLAKPEVKEMSAGLEEIAQAVAVAVEDKALTQRIYEKCLEKFDGETNTLWMHLEADGKLKGNGGWNKRIDAELGKGRKNAVVKGIGNIDAAIRKFEKTVGAPLHLFWMYPSQWDKKTTPLVAFVPFDANPKTRTSIPAFDAKGNRFELSNNGALAKQRPVIVLSVNERTDINGDVQKGMLVGNSHEDPIPSNQKYFSLLKNQTKKREQNPSIQNWYPVYGFTPSGIDISTSFVDAENEPSWGGTMEFFYAAKRESNPNLGIARQTVYLGTGFGFTNRNLYGIGIGNVYLPTYDYASDTEAYVHYWEADFPGFDDFVTTHHVPRATSTNGFIEHIASTPLVYAGYRYR